MHILRYITNLLLPKNILIIFVGIFICFFTFVAFSRHENMHSKRLDLGNMEQVVWNVVHGNGFTLTDPMGESQQSRLAVHADFLLILLAPFYFLWQDPRMLIFIQIVVMGLGAIPIYWIAKRVLGSERLALFFSTVYLLYPPLQRMTLHDFHAVALSITFLLFSYWFLETKRYGWFVFFGVLAALGKETEWVTFGFMGLYVAFRHKKYALGSIVGIVGMGMFYYLYWHLMPAQISGGQHFALRYLSEYGDSQNGVVRGLLGNPWTVFTTLIQPNRLYYYFQLFLPVSFLSLVSPSVLIFSIHSIFINTLSSNGLMRQIDYQYTSNIIPFVFISAIFGFKKLRAWVKAMRKKVSQKYIGTSFWAVGVLSVVVSVYMWGEIPLTNQDRFFFFLWSIPEKQSVERIRERISDKATVSATNNIGSHFSNREKLYNFPVNATRVDYVVALLGDQFAWPSGHAQRQAVDALLKSSEYTLILQDKDLYAFEKIQYETKAD